MRIQLRNAAILGLFFVLVTATSQAQTRGEVNIPFDFSAGSAKLKAGIYTVKRMSANALAIRSVDGKTTALVNAPLTLGSRESRAGQRLVFNKYGDHYFLSQIWLRVDSGRQLFPTAEETRASRDHRLADRNAKPERREVALSTR